MGITEEEKKEAAELFSVLNKIKIPEAQKQFVLGFATCLAYLPKVKETA